MLSFVCLLALAATASAAHMGLPMLEQNPLLNNRIVGGENTDISRVPYQISLQVGSFHICGGSILTNRFVLTASHCIIGNEPNWNRMSVRVGSTYSNQGGQFIKVSKLHSHPRYNPSNSWHSDIAILELANPIQLNSNAQPVSLPPLNAQYPIGAMATASGWGNLQEGGSAPIILQSVRIPIQDPSVCERAYGSSSFQRDVHLCAASTLGGQSTCQGDSGGPLVYQGVQYGIVSWARGCARPNYPTVFANVANLRGFITDVVGI